MMACIATLKAPALTLPHQQGRGLKAVLMKFYNFVFSQNFPHQFHPPCFICGGGLGWGQNVRCGQNVARFLTGETT